MNARSPGDVLAGRFEVSGAPIATGSIGVVYPGIDRENQGEVAIKFLHPHLVLNDLARRRLEVEAAAASRLSHEHIVGVVGLFSDAGSRFLVTRRLRGHTVQALQSKMSLESVLALGVQLALALRAAHGANLVHGDVRPGAVMLTSEGAILFDFSMSVAREQQGGQNRDYRPGETAPEVHGGGVAGVPADLYGLGVVLVRALTGRMPFEGPTPWAIIGAQHRETTIIDEAPRGLRVLIRSLLHPDPTRRPSDAEGVHTALQALQRDPHQIARPGWRWIAPIRPRREWAVHGTDPATGGPALIADGLNRGAAHALALRLTNAGWDVRPEKVAIGARDLVAIGAVSAILGVLLPIVGGIGGMALGLLFATSRCRPRVVESLPRVVAALPPHDTYRDRSSQLVIGLLMIACAFWMWVAPSVGIVLGLVLLVVVRERSSTTPTALQLAEQALVARCFEEARLTIEQNALQTDDALALEGELRQAEDAWAQRELTVEEVVHNAQKVAAKAVGGVSTARIGAEHTLAALTAARAEVEDT